MLHINASDISTIRPLQKLSHHRLGPFLVEWQVSHNAYRLWLPFPMRHLHLVFNVIKLIPSPADLIASQHPILLPLLEVIEGKEEYLEEEVLDTPWMAQVQNQVGRIQPRAQQLGIHFQSTCTRANSRLLPKKPCCI